MKYFKEIIFSLLVISFALILFNCTSIQVDVSKSTIANNKTQLSQEVEILTICELFKDPYSYGGRLIKLKTNLYRIADVTTVEDENCIQRHHLIDVTFAPEFESSVCNPVSDKSVELCLLAKATKQNKEYGDYQLTATIIGYFEYYFAKEGFTQNGLRFRFIVKEINNVEKFTPVKADKLQK